MINKRLFIIGGVLFLLLLIPFAIYQQINIRREAKLGYIEFNKAKLNGRIIKVSTSGGLNFFTLNNIDRRFVFSANPADCNRRRLFYNTASKGDSIIKKSYSDTLLLIHNGKKYFYTISKVD